MTTPNTADLAALVAAVRAEHRPYHGAGEWEGTCVPCQVRMPCPTIAAIDGLERRATDDPRVPDGRRPR